MVGLLGKAPLTSDISLFIEIAIVVTLFIGRFKFARKKRFQAHGFTLTAAVCLHAFNIVLVMVPSFAVSWNILLTDFSSPAILVTWIHAPLGAAILVLGVYLISTWRFRAADENCRKKGRLMRTLWLLWVFNLILGVFLYASIAFR